VTNTPTAIPTRNTFRISDTARAIFMRVDISYVAAPKRR
jgi:hypothetical protein